MTQNIEQSLWAEFEDELYVKAKHKESLRVHNSEKPKTPWMSKIVEKVKISELAREHGINECPECHYGISFDDSRGWFICINAKYNHSCDFKGNIVDFCEKTRCFD